MKINKIKFTITIFGLMCLSCNIIDSRNSNDGITKLYVTLQGTDQISVYNTPDLTLLKIIDIDFGIKDTPHFIVIDEKNGYWFATMVESGYVAQYSLGTDELLDSVYVGDFPALMTINSNDKKLYVSRMMMYAES